MNILLGFLACGIFGFCLWYFAFVDVRTQASTRIEPNTDLNKVKPIGKYTSVDDVLRTLEKLYNDFTMRKDDERALDWAINFIRQKTDKKGSSYECFHCGADAVYWNNDFSLEDYGYEGEGIVHSCTCGNCGADIEYVIRFDEEEEGE